MVRCYTKYPKDEAREIIRRVAYQNDLHVFFIGSWFYITKERTLTYWDRQQLSPGMTGWVHGRVHPCCVRLHRSPSGFLTLPSALMFLIVFLVFWIVGMPLSYALPLSCVPSVFSALVTGFYAFTDSGQEILQNMDTFVEELQTEFSKYTPDP